MLLARFPAVRLGPVCVALALLVLSCATPSTDSVLLRGARTIDVEAGELTAPMDVFVEGGRIRTIEPANSGQRSAAQVIDAQGRYLMPHFIEMHAHILLHPWMPDGEIARQYDRETFLQTLRLLLAHGVTTARDPGSPAEAALFMRQQLRDGEIEGPTLYTAGRILISGPFPYEAYTEVRIPDDVRREIHWQAQAGVDFIKIYSSFRPELIRVAVEEAHAHNLPIVGHLGATSWTEAAGLGLDGFEHPSDWSRSLLPANAPPARRRGIAARTDWLEAVEPEGPAIARMADAIAAADAFVDPTLITVHSEFFGDRPMYRAPAERALVPEMMWNGWKAGSFTRDWSSADYAAAQAAYPRLTQIIRVLHDHGVMLVVGTDTPTPWTIPGVSFHQKMALLQETGVSNADVLRMATINRARALHIEDSVGRVAPGFEADMLLLTANPLEDLANARAIERVLIDGRVVEPAALLDQSAP